MRRPTLHAILALLVVAVFAAPAQAAGAAADGQRDPDRDARGVLRRRPPGARRGRRPALDLRTEHGTVPVDFAGRGPRRLIGAKVALTGTRRGGVLELASSAPGPELRVLDRSTTAGRTPESVQADASPVAKTFAVVLINFTNLATQPWTKATVASAVTGAAPSLKTFYEEESKGRMTDRGDGLRLVHDQRDDHRLRLADVAHARLERGDRGRSQPERVHERDVHLAADGRVRVRGGRLRAGGATPTSTARSASRS